MGFLGLLIFVLFCRPIVPRGGILPFSFKIFQFGLQNSFKGSDGDFGMSVRLWMCWGRVVILNSELSAEISEFGVVELLSVVRHQGSWDTKAAYDGPPYKIVFLLFCDCG